MINEIGMDLKDFVTTTLLSIVNGILEAQADEVCGAHVGRAPQKAAALSIARDGDGNVVSLVTFDLATTIEDRSAAGGGVGIKVVPVLNLKAEGKTENASSSISRIGFSVPISVPRPAAQIADDEARMRRISENQTRMIEKLAR